MDKVSGHGAGIRIPLQAKSENRLPNLVLQNIFRHLSADDLGRACVVCKRWKRLGEPILLSKIYEALTPMLLKFHRVDLPSYTPEEVVKKYLNDDFVRDLDYKAPSTYRDLVFALRASANLSGPDSLCKTALFEATEHNNAKVVELLLGSLRADPNQKDDDGWTALFTGVNKGHNAVVKLLLRYGADPNMESDDVGTPLGEATSHQNEPLVLLLLENGANPESKIEGDTALVVAARARNTVLMAMLTDMGADPNQKDDEGDTLLHIFAKQNDIEMVDILLLNGADPNIEDANGNTPLQSMSYSWGDQYNLAERLLKAGAAPDQIDISGDTRLHRFARTNNDEMASLFLLYDANPNIVNKSDETPLDIATEGGNWRTVELLLRGRANPNRKDEGGNALLYRLVQKNKNKEIELLLESDANFEVDIDIQNRDGDTPLHIAARQGSLSMVELLLHSRADREIVNDAGDSPADVATEDVAWRLE